MRTMSFDGVPVVSTTELCQRLGLTVSAEKLKALDVAKPYAETSVGIYWRECDVFPVALALAAMLSQRAGLLELQRLAAKYPRDNPNSATPPDAR